MINLAEIINKAGIKKKVEWIQIKLKVDQVMQEEKKKRKRHAALIEIQIYTRSIIKSIKHKSDT